MEREHCRRLTMPVILSGLKEIGELRGLERFGDFVAVCLMTLGGPISLKFSDDDAAEDEGYMLWACVDSIGPVKMCRGTNCGVGCGCGCLRDFGYSTETYKASEDDCITIHESIPDPVIDKPLFTLRKTRKMVDDLVVTFMQSLILGALP
jgi:hypothetical protein